MEIFSYIAVYCLGWWVVTVDFFFFFNDLLVFLFLMQKRDMFVEDLVQTGIK